MFFEEPDMEDDNNPELSPAWRIDFTYPDGPRDAEAVAVDVESEQVFVLSKRDVPARLYAVPLRPDTDEALVATRIGFVGTLPQPTKVDIDMAQALKSWHWQPTAMDIAPDGSAIAVLTYAAVYLYSRQSGESIVASLRRPPLKFDLHRVHNAESMSFGQDASTLFITVEQQHAPLLRIDISGDLQ